MRRLILLLLSSAAFAQGPTVPFPFVPQSTAPPSIVQSVGDSSATYQTNPTTQIVLSGVTSPDVLVLWVGTLSGVSSISTPTGCGVTFSAQGTFTNSEIIFLAPVSSSSGACTVSISSTSSGSSAIQAVLFEVSHVTTSTPVISSYHAGSYCTTSCVGATVATTVANSMMLSFMGCYGVGSTFSSPSPFTYDINATDNQGVLRGGGHYLQASTGTYSPTYAYTPGATFCDVSIGLHP